MEAKKINKGSEIALQLRLKSFENINIAYKLRVRRQQQKVKVSQHDPLATIFWESAVTVRFDVCHEKCLSSVPMKN